MIRTLLLLLIAALLLGFPGCSPAEKPIDPARLEKLGATDADLQRAMEWSNLFTTRESALSHLESGYLPLDCLRQGTSKETFRTCWKTKSQRYQVEWHLDMIMDARWGQFFQWSVIWRCFCALFLFSLLGSPLQWGIENSAEGSAMKGVCGCLGAILSLVIALPALWYLLVGIF